jgi:hypothetical protein
MMRSAETVSKEKLSRRRRSKQQQQQQAATAGKWSR